MYISVFPVIFETHALLILDDMHIYNSNKKSGFLFSQMVRPSLTNNILNFYPLKRHVIFCSISVPNLEDKECKQRTMRDMCEMRVPWIVYNVTHVITRQGRRWSGQWSDMCQWSSWPARFHTSHGLTPPVWSHLLTADYLCLDIIVKVWT